MAYQFKSRIRYSEVGEDQKLTIPGLINYFQDSSTFQSEGLGAGLKVMTERKKAWILAYWQIQIHRLPEMGEYVVTETWPSSFKGFFGDRSFRMLDEAGNMLACANSLWIYLDVESGRPSRVEEEISSRYVEVLEEAIPMEMSSRKILMPDNCVEQEHFLVMNSHLDTNHHVNNSQYISMAKEYLPKDFTVGQIRVEYRTQAVLHDEIVPIVCVQEKTCTVGLCDTNGKPYAVLEFKKSE